MRGGHVSNNIACCGCRTPCCSGTDVPVALVIPLLAPARCLASCTCGNIDSAESKSSMVAASDVDG